MRIGISLTSNHPRVKDPRQGARWVRYLGIEVDDALAISEQVEL
jgi:hypothetical protein